MALKWRSDIRPHLVLECSFEQKRIGREREEKRGEELGLEEDQVLVGFLSIFLLLCDQVLVGFLSISLEVEI